jgi:hypothetical protein
MQSAAQHYKLFLDSFRGADGQLPPSVEPEMEQHYLSCLFSMARMLQGLPHTGTLGSKAGPDSKPEGARCVLPGWTLLWGTSVCMLLAAVLTDCVTKKANRTPCTHDDMFLHCCYVGSLLLCRQEVATLDEAVSLLGALVKYVHDNNVADWQEQADMARELGSLLKEKLDLVHRFSEL